MTVWTDLSNLQHMFLYHSVPLTYQYGRRNDNSWIILCTRPANKRRRYIVTSSFIGWAHTQNDPWLYFSRNILTVLWCYNFWVSLAVFIGSICCIYIFIDILHGCFIDIWTIIWLPAWQWRKWYSAFSIVIIEIRKIRRQNDRWTEIANRDTKNTAKYIEQISVFINSMSKVRILRFIHRHRNQVYQVSIMKFWGN